MIADLDAMSYDARLLQRLVDEQLVTVEALAQRSGYADKTIYRYLEGDRTVPSTVLRAAFELTRDSRILSLISGDVPIVRIEQVSPSKPRGAMPLLRETLATTLDAVEKAATSGRYMHDIAKDGRFDASDLTAADKFAAHAGRAQVCLANALAAIEAYKFQAAQEAKR